MADQSINELIKAQTITAKDLFVLEQGGEAKSLEGQVLINWLTKAADGHGGIQSIDKVGSSGLTDSYRITLADTTTFDFQVKNGRSVTSITKTNTSGLVDTYTIRYNDGSTTTVTVTNGAKGDKGDNANVFIKYASRKPTQGSHSFGDIPDRWMGVYSGHAQTAPTDYTAYDWYEIKGEKGDTGNPATLQEAKTEYQVGTSGSIVPSGVWQVNVPVVGQGQYLWVRNTIQFNSGDPMVSYSVSRFGIDGKGAVASVAGVSPDPDGNVPLTAQAVQALPIAGGAMSGSIDMAGQRMSGLPDPATDTDAVPFGYAEGRYLQQDRVVNDFTVNQPGYVLDARAGKILKDEHKRSYGFLEFPPNSTVRVTFSYYKVAALIFTVINNESVVIPYSNGYWQNISPKQTNVTAEISSDWKSITIINHTNSKGFIGVINPSNSEMTIEQI